MNHPSVFLAASLSRWGCRPEMSTTKSISGVIGIACGHQVALWVVLCPPVSPIHCGRPLGPLPHLWSPLPPGKTSARLSLTPRERHRGGERGGLGRRTRRLWQRRTTATMCFPMSWTSPSTVAITMVPRSRSWRSRRSKGAERRAASRRHFPVGSKSGCGFIHIGNAEPVDGVRPRPVVLKRRLAHSSGGGAGDLSLAIPWFGS